MPQQLYAKTTGDSGRGLGKFLGELELAVMEVVWERQPVSVSDVLHALNSDIRSWAYTTIMTIMNRLEAKGWLASEKPGRALIYRATWTREEAESKMAAEIVRSLLQDFGDVAITQFMKELDRLDPEQLAHLTELTQQNKQDDNR